MSDDIVKSLLITYVRQSVGPPSPWLLIGPSPRISQAHGEAGHLDPMTEGIGLMSNIRNAICIVALVGVGAVSGPALGAQDYDPARAFIERIEGRQALAPKSAGPAVNSGDSNPAQDFIDRLGGVGWPTGIVASHVDGNPAQDFLDRLAGIDDRADRAVGGHLEANSARLDFAVKLAGTQQP